MDLKKIEIYGGLQSDFDDNKSLFSWYYKPDKPIIVFYGVNGTGKSTLFLILKKMITLENLTGDEIYIKKDSSGKGYIIKNVYLELDINGKNLEIEYKDGNISYKLQGENLNKIQLENIYYEEIFNQNKHLEKVNKSGISNRKTTIKSLSRFFFFGDDTYYHNTQKNSCNLIDTHKDGKYERLILFYYLLGEDFLKWGNDILNYTGSYIEAKEKYENVEKELEKKGYYSSLEDGRLLNPIDTYKEKEKSIKELEEDYDGKYSLLYEISSAIEKLSLLENDLDYINSDNIKNFIQKEKKYLEERHYQIKNEINILESEIDDLKSDQNLIADINNYSEFEELKYKRDQLEYELETNKEGEQYITESGERDKLKQNFEDIYINFIKDAGYNNSNITLKFDLEKEKIGDLVLKINKEANKKGDGHLRICRLLILAALHSYKDIYQDLARFPGIAFFDAAMDGVSNDNIINFYQTLINMKKSNYIKNIQLFYFVVQTTIEKRNDELYEFFKDNSDNIDFIEIGEYLFDI